MSRLGNSWLRSRAFDSGVPSETLPTTVVSFLRRCRLGGGGFGEFEGANQWQAVADQVGHGLEELNVEASAQQASEQRQAETKAIPALAVLF